MKNLFFSSLILLSSKSSKAQTVFSETFNAYEVILLRGCTQFNCESLKVTSRTRCLELTEAHLWSKKSYSSICFPARFTEKSIMLENKTVKNDVASNQKSEFPKLVLIDTIGYVLQKEKAKRMLRAEFMPVYIGDKKKEIIITCQSPMFYENRRSQTSQSYKSLASNSITISIDTNQAIGSPWGARGDSYDKPLGSLYKISYPIVIENLSIDTLIVGVGMFLPLVAEAQDVNGVWKPIQSKALLFCGTKQTEYYLCPKQIAITTINQFDGPFKTKLRVVWKYYGGDLKVYSNEIDCYLDKRQFEELKSE